ncbi:AAA family ATPase [Pseudarthrobacter sp. LT1]|uniref:AAA family ATPase n=1 Tax=Pseudarthrobacter sp. LT1 TaxID=3111450 RepID=UPI002D77E2EA|nr:AAA family ATPase [Pseudarthrobacter sp. LT1]WRT14688.1 AAA family ATPase [Pseudarthrobacter sp. LT1]
MSKIVRLESTNYKRLKAVEILPDPDGSLVIVAGKNGQGKSSILDSITAALGGVNGKTTPKPIRDGEERAEIVLETEDLVVTRRFTASGSTLTVKSPDGAVYPKGQAKLDDLLGKLSLDPLAFTQLSDRDQLATLLDLVELPFDPAQLAAERKEVFDQRTEANRKVKDLTTRAAEYITRPANLPDEEVSVSALLSEYRAAQNIHAQQATDRDALAGAQSVVDSINEQIAELIKRREEAEASVARLTVRVEDHDEAPDLEAIQVQIDSAEQVNAAVRHHKAGEKVRAALTLAQQEAAELTAGIEQIDKQKAEGLAAAKFPIEGLGFDESGVTYNGVPFKQASSAEQLRVSLAMAIALNPKLRVIRIADGSLLDTDNLALVESIARENDYQVWIEMVGDAGGRGIVIEDGGIKE